MSEHATFARAVQRIAIAEFTERELEVAYLLVVECLPTDEVAGRLSISPRTIDSHITNIRGKLPEHITDGRAPRLTPLFAAYWFEAGRSAA